jgi:hypothetical protein
MASQVFMEWYAFVRYVTSNFTPRIEVPFE